MGLLRDIVNLKENRGFRSTVRLGWYLCLSVQVGELVVTLGHDARYPDVDVQHDDHWDEEGTHGGKNYVAGVLVVATGLVVVSAWFVPEIVECSRKKFWKTYVELKKAKFG